MRYVTDDAEVAHQALTATGSTPHQEVLYTDFAPPMFTVEDPDGNMVILIQEDDNSHAGAT